MFECGADAAAWLLRFLSERRARANGAKHASEGWPCCDDILRAYADPRPAPYLTHPGPHPGPLIRGRLRLGTTLVRLRRERGLDARFNPGTTRLYPHPLSVLGWKSESEPCGQWGRTRGKHGAKRGRTPLFYHGPGQGPLGRARGGGAGNHGDAFPVRGARHGPTARRHGPFMSSAALAPIFSVYCCGAITGFLFRYHATPLFCVVSLVLLSWFSLDTHTTYPPTHAPTHRTAATRTGTRVAPPGRRGVSFRQRISGSRPSARCTGAHRAGPRFTAVFTPFVHCFDPARRILSVVCCLLPFITDIRRAGGGVTARISPYTEIVCIRIRIPVCYFHCPQIRSGHVRGLGGPTPAPGAARQGHAAAFYGCARELCTQPPRHPPWPMLSHLCFLAADGIT